MISVAGELITILDELRNEAAEYKKLQLEIALDNSWFLVASMCCIVLIATLFLLYHQLEENRRTRRWKKVKALVLESREVEIDGITGYYLKYQFEIDNRGVIVSDNAINKLHYRHLNTRLKKLNSGSEITIFANPDNPKETIIEKPKPKVVKLLFGILIFTTVFLLIIVISIVN